MTSVSFSITAIVVFWGITRVQLLDIIPTAHQKFFGSIPDGVIILGGIKQVVDLNSSAESLIGIKISEAREKKLEDLHISWKEFLDLYSKQSNNKEYRGTLLKEGNFYEVSIVGIYNKEDIFIGQLIVLHDITKRKIMEMKLKDSNKKIEDLNETLQIMNKILRHDLLNKLTVMKSSLWLFEEKSDNSSLDRLNRSIDSGIELIERIRELESFIMAEGELIPISIREIAEEVSNNVNIPVTINGNATALADQALFSVFENIYRNAIIHGKTDKIDVNISSKKNICEIIITDYGEGIPEFIKDNVFEEGLSYGSNKGSGLGLYIVKKTIERYGGSISVGENKPKGTVFIIKLKCPKN
jgi:signal transduction histidine kinase